MAHTTTDTFVGDALDGWSMPSSWRDATPPTSNPHLNIDLRHNSTEDLGTLAAPLQVHDVTNVGVEGDGTLIDITGHLIANNMTGVDTVTVAGVAGGSGAGLHITGRTDVQTINMFSGSRSALGDTTVEIGRDTVPTAFNFGVGQFGVNSRETLILDHPTAHKLDNPITIQDAGQIGQVAIELGHLKFDAADLLPPVFGQSRQVQLTNHGQPVYTLDNVTLGGSAQFAAVSYGGVDQNTGFNTLVFHSANSTF